MPNISLKGSIYSANKRPEIMAGLWDWAVDTAKGTYRIAASPVKAATHTVLEAGRGVATGDPLRVLAAPVKGVSHGVAEFGRGNVDVLQATGENIIAPVVKGGGHFFMEAGRGISRGNILQILASPFKGMDVGRSTVKDVTDMFKPDFKSTPEGQKLQHSQDRKVYESREKTARDPVIAAKQSAYEAKIAENAQQYIPLLLQLLRLPQDASLEQVQSAWLKEVDTLEKENRYYRILKQRGIRTKPMSAFGIQLPAMVQFLQERKGTKGANIILPLAAGALGLFLLTR
jgi:hypothetical protein